MAPGRRRTKRKHARQKCDGGGGTVCRKRGTAPEREEAASPNMQQYLPISIGICVYFSAFSIMTLNCPH